MSPHSNWRGQRRIRVALEFSARGMRIAGMRPVDGPAVQRPALDGSHVAQVMIGGTTAILHSFNDPRLVRGISRPRQPGHSFTRTDYAIVYVDVPISVEGPVGEITINISDLSKLRSRPVQLGDVEAFLNRPPRGLRTIGRITDAQLQAHPDWANLGLPGTPVIPRIGHYEIYRDRTKKFHWRLRRPDGRIVAESSRSYPDRAECEADLRWIKEAGARAPVRSLDIPSQPTQDKQRR